MNVKIVKTIRGTSKRRGVRTGHAEVGRDVRGVRAARAGRRRAPVAAGPAAPHVLLAEARLAAQARVLPQAVARLTCDTHVRRFHTYNLHSL